MRMTGPAGVLLTPLPFDLQIPLAAAVLAVVVWLLLESFGRRCRPGSLPRALLLSGRLSLTGAILLAGLGWWLAQLADPALVNLAHDGAEVRDLLLTIGVVWTLLRWKGELAMRAEHYGAQLLPRLSERDRLFLLDVLDKLIGTAAALIVVLELLELLGVSAGVVLTAGGFGAAALAFGARTIVENGLSGLSLYINRPFTIGETISLPALKLLGTVETVGWFYTELRDPERQRLYIPNGLFTSQALINTARIDHRRLWIEFNLRRGDRARVEAITTALEQHLAGLEGLDHCQEPAVHLVGYGDTGLQLRLLCYSAGGEPAAAWALRQRLLLLIGDVVEQHGAALAPASAGTKSPGAAPP